MRATAKASLVAIAAFACLLAWGYWHAAYQNSQQEYAACYEVHSAWASGWASRVRSATVTVGGCALGNLPVNVYSSNADWWLWWVPLPHVGGTPRRYFEHVVKVNTKSCTAVSQ